MISDVIFDRIEAVASKPGTKEKASMLVELNSDGGDFFRKVIFYSYNPLFSYGTQLGDIDLKSEIGKGLSTFDEVTWGLLDDLAGRALTGHAASEAIRSELRRLTPKSAELLCRVILKDLRAGFSVGTLEKVCPKLLPTFPYMRCGLPKDTKLEEWPWDEADEGVVSQEKSDGMFSNVNVDSSSVWLTTRQGTPIPEEGFKSIYADARLTLKHDTQTHGEMLVLDAEGTVLERKDGNGIINSVISGGSWPEGHRPILRVWDQIPLSAVVPKGSCKTPYGQRLKALREQIDASSCIELTETVPVKSIAEAFAHYAEKLKEGKEGTVLKRLDMVWKDHTSPGQIKFKLTAPCELKVVGKTKGKGKNASTFGALMCESSCGLLKVNVGSGLKDFHRHEEWDDAIITVKFNGINLSNNLNKKAHSLFLPVFVERRTDKSEADDLVRIQDQMQAAIDSICNAGAL